MWRIPESPTVSNPGANAVMQSIGVAQQDAEALLSVAGATQGLSDKLEAFAIKRAKARNAATTAIELASWNDAVADMDMEILRNPNGFEGWQKSWDQKLHEVKKSTFEKPLAPAVAEELNLAWERFQSSSKIRFAEAALERGIQHDRAMGLQAAESFKESGNLPEANRILDSLEDSGTIRSEEKSRLSQEWGRESSLRIIEEDIRNDPASAEDILNGAEFLNDRQRAGFEDMAAKIIADDQSNTYNTILYWIRTEGRVSEEIIQSLLDSGKIDEGQATSLLNYNPPSEEDQALYGRLVKEAAKFPIGDTANDAKERERINLEIVKAAGRLKASQLDSINRIIADKAGPSSISKRAITIGRGSANERIDSLLKGGAFGPFDIENESAAGNKEAKEAADSARTHIEFFLESVAPDIPPKELPRAINEAIDRVLRLYKGVNLDAASPSLLDNSGASELFDVDYDKILNSEDE